MVSIESFCLQEFSKHTQDVLSQNPTELVYYLRVTLQHINSAAHKGQEPLLNYRLRNESQPAVQTLLKVAAGLSHSGGLPPGMFQGTVSSVCRTELSAVNPQLHAWVCRRGLQPYPGCRGDQQS